MQHNFDIDIATKYGVNIAIFLNNMAFWIHKNIANERHFYDGRYWTYNSKKSYAQIFPYWSEKQIRTIVDNCKSLGLIVTGNYNEHQYDQTLWYSMTDEACKLLNLIMCPNGQMDLTERANGFDRKGRPIPDIKPDIKPDREPSTEKPSPAALSFQPDNQNQKLAQKLGVDYQAELKSFLAKKPKRHHTQAYFEDWLQQAKRHKEKHQSQPVQERRSTEVFWGPGHPSFDSIHGVPN